MLNFDKIEQEVARIENFSGVLLLRHLRPSRNLNELPDREIISDVIKSKFHSWRGEEDPDGLTVNLTTSDKDKNVQNRILEHHKFYGFFDNSKISSDNYTLIPFETVKKKLSEKIDEWNTDISFKTKAEVILTDKLNPSATFYHLDLDENIDSKIVAEWQVYTFFMSFIAIDRQNDIITLIEFSQD